MKKVYDLMQQGKTEEYAENKTLVEFGDINDIKQELKNGVKSDESDKQKAYSLKLGFSVWSSALIIALVIFVNIVYTPTVPWFVYPTFGLLWWPLVMFFRWLKHK